MPLVAQLVGAELGRPVAVDAHPKHAVALGAAWLASGTTGAAAAAGVAGAAAGAGIAGAAGAAAAGAAAGRPSDPHRTYAGAASVPSTPATPSALTAPAAPVSPAPPVAPPPRATAPVSPAPAVPRFERATAPVSPPVRSTTPATYGSAASLPPVAPPRPAGPAPGSRRRVLVVAGATLAIVLAASTVAWAVTRNTGDDTGGGPGGLGTDAPTEAPVDPTGSPEGNQQTESPPPPLDEQCTDQIRSNERWVCLTSAVMEGDQLVIHYDVEWAGSIPDINGGFHLHIYGGDGTNPSDEIMGTHAANRGVWKIKDENPAVLSADDIAEAVGDAEKVCARIAEGQHQLVQDNSGGYTTGNCIPIQR
jgi:hypothetical protein